jgi:ribulose 1,5-bisphosphate synthetase/thiazole synthase
MTISRSLVAMNSVAVAISLLLGAGSDVGGGNMVRRVVKDEVEKLMRELGAGAYENARETMRAARRQRNARMEQHFAKVATEIARWAGREIEVDTATRYLER